MELKESKVESITLQELKEGATIDVHDDIGQIHIKIGRYKFAISGNWVSVEDNKTNHSYWTIFEKDYIMFNTYKNALSICGERDGLKMKPGSSIIFKNEE